MRIYRLLFCIIYPLITLASCSESDENKSTEKELLNFKIENVNCVIQNNVIKIHIDSDMPTVYAPRIEVSPKAKIKPASGEQVDLKNPITYTVTAEDGSSKVYTTELIVNQKLSSEKEILKFTVEGYKTEIKDGKLYIYGLSWQNKYGIPVVETSEKATVSPIFTERFILSWITKFTVTAEDGSTKEYPVIYSQADGIEEIKLNFQYNGESRMKYVGIFDEVAKTITIDYARTRNNEYEGVLEIKTVGDATTNPKTGTPLEKILESISVTTKSGTENYTLRIRNTDAYIGKLNLPVVIGESRYASYVNKKYTEGLGNLDLCVFTIDNQNLKNIKPSVFEYSDFATVSPSPTIAQDFSKDVEYTVTSQSGITNKIKIRTIHPKILVTNEINNSDYISYSTVSSTFFEYYHAIGQVSKVEMVNTITKEVISCTLSQQQEVTSEKNYYYMVIYTSKTPPKDDIFFMRVTFPDGSVVDTDARYKFNQ